MVLDVKLFLISSWHSSVTGAYFPVQKYDLAIDENTKRRKQVESELEERKQSSARTISHLGSSLQEIDLLKQKMASLSFVSIGIAPGLHN